MPNLKSVITAANDFKRDLRIRAGVTNENDKRSCKELLAHGMVEHKHNLLLVQAAEIIDDFLLVLSGTAADDTHVMPDGCPR